jgi:lipoyl synthase
VVRTNTAAPVASRAGARRRLPPWIRVRVPASGQPAAVAALVAAGRLHTVCQSALCPNEPECFGRGTATFMILGEVCTRACGFCAVRGGRPRPPDPGEPARVAAAAAALALRHVVITSVTRDDLADGGAAAFAATVRAVRASRPPATIEVLVPDFGGDAAALGAVLAAGPDVLNHNLETVRRLQARIRPQADYERSLGVLRAAARWAPRPVVKSGLMLGLGETDAELAAALRDLRAAGCDALTLGQSLAASPAHAPVARFVRPAAFARWRQRALGLGFAAVAAGPLVRSSYHAGELLGAARDGAGPAAGRGGGA